MLAQQQVEAARTHFEEAVQLLRILQSLPLFDETWLTGTKLSLQQAINTIEPWLVENNLTPQLTTQYLNC